MLETTKKQIMKRVNRVSILVLWLSVIAAFPAIVLADEGWTSNIGDIIYEDNVANTAVFLLARPTYKMRFFIFNLAPDVDAGRNRGTYKGYWTDSSKRGVCEASLTDSMGTATRSWGRFTITFEKPKGQKKSNEYVPWNWTGYTGSCFDEPNQEITAIGN